MFMLNNSVTSRISSPPTASVAVSIAMFTYTILAFILVCTTSIFSNAFRSINPLFRSRCQAVTTDSTVFMFLAKGSHFLLALAPVNIRWYQQLFWKDLY